MNSSTWKVGLKPVGKYYHAGIVNDVEGILENHKLNTKSCFGTRSSVKKKINAVPLEYDKENRVPVSTIVLVLYR